MSSISGGNRGIEASPPQPQPQPPKHIESPSRKPAQHSAEEAPKNDSSRTKEGVGGAVDVSA